MNIIKSITLLLAVTLPYSASAALQTYENTWFEIEVILFKQLSDKSQIQEVFSETNQLSQPEKIIDILRPYLAFNNKEELKAAFPQCAHFPLIPDITEESLLQGSDVKETEVNTTQGINNLESDVTLTNTESEEKKFNINHVFVDHNGPALLTMYETQEPSYDAFYSAEISCELSTLNVPDVIVGEEDLTTELPYIINDESLKLHDIMENLKQSRSFKPLLHIGWRQITRLKSEAVPVKLVAGENLVASYLTAFADYNAAMERQELEALVKEVDSTVKNDPFSILVSNSEQIVTDSNEFNYINELTSPSNSLLDNADKNIEIQIAQIIEEAKTQTHDFDSVLNELNGLTSDAQYIASPLSSDNEKTLIAPEYPPQEWSIEGFLKVEVERFLHIRADFNIINMSIAEQATQQLTSSEPKSLQSIHFKQDKRVKSNEIHYFDHPYMGMIVQIRRHEQVAPELPEALETPQSIELTDIVTSKNITQE